MVGLALAIAPAAARAQTGFNLSLTSDDRYRGYSLSTERPAALATVTYDAANGVYASATGVAVATAHDGLKVAGFQAIVGYAHRLGSETSWEAGVAATEVMEYYQPRYRVSFQEAYVGLATGNLSAHLYYSPTYLGEEASTLYAALDATTESNSNWRVFGHVGLLIPVHRRAGSEIERAQVDANVGVSRRIGDLDLQVTLSSFGPDNDLIGEHYQRHTAVVAAATRYF